MEELSPKRRVLATLRGEKVDRPPVTSIGGCEGTVIVDVQKATGVYLPEAHKNPEKMAKLAIASQNLTGLENIKVPFDVVVEAEALGCGIKWVDKMIES
ncbi:MAG: uroporphyrinogen decarboxylase family protein [Nitrososphaerales archaeon]